MSNLDNIMLLNLQQIAKGHGDTATLAQAILKLQEKS